MIFLTLLLVAIIYAGININHISSGSSSGGGSSTKIVVKVSPQYSTQHHFSLVMKHYHPMFDVQIDNTSNSNKDQLTIVTQPEANKLNLRAVASLYNAELFLVGHRQSFIDKIQDLRKSKLTVNIGPKASQLETISKRLIQEAGLEIGNDIYTTNYSDEEVIKLFGYAIDLCFVLDATPNRFLSDLSLQHPLTFLDINLGPIEMFTPVHININEHRVFYPSLNNFRFKHIWSYQTPFVLATPIETDETIVLIAKETIEEFSDIFSQLPYWR